MLQQERLEYPNDNIVTQYYDQVLGLRKYVKILEELGSVYAHEHNHTLRVLRFTLNFACTFNLSPIEMQRLARCVIVHDIGKVLIPPGVELNPGTLNLDERRIMAQHPIYSYQLLKGFPRWERLQALCHHDPFDKDSLMDMSQIKLSKKDRDLIASCEFKKELELLQIGDNLSSITDPDRDAIYRKDGLPIPDAKIIEIMHRKFGHTELVELAVARLKPST